MRRNEVAALALIVVFLAVGLYFLPRLPEQMASHWSAAGQVNGYTSRFWGVFLLPLIYAGVVLLFLAIPRIDPLAANIEQFRPYYDGLIAALSLFLLAVYLQTLLWNVGVRVSPNVLLPIGAGLLFFYVGILLEHAKRNWFIGIRTPWTLSSDHVWAKTHKVGSTLFKIAGAIATLGAFFDGYAIWFILVPVIFVAVYTIVYSLVVYRQENV